MTGGPYPSARVVGGPARQRRARGERPSGPRGEERERGGRRDGPGRPKGGKGDFKEAFTRILIILGII
uniref:Uncharacterized protein n=1 Tax=Oryza sativa subsp. japonica TaxID=39947 RepID=Q6Z5Q6_ORYSJ|nr:hypothetical protein [Oryza sativa Japonica Group]